MKIERNEDMVAYFFTEYPDLQQFGIEHQTPSRYPTLNGPLLSRKRDLNRPLIASNYDTISESGISAIEVGNYLTQKVCKNSDG